MAATDNTSAALTGSSEESTLAKMFKSVLTEIKELKETVAPLVEPAYEDERDDNLEQDDEESTANDPGNKPTEKASGSKLLAEIVRELDISEKTGDEVDEGLVKLMDGLLKVNYRRTKSKLELRNIHGLRTPRVNPLIWNQIPVQVRTSDSKSQKSQNALVASIVAMIKATNLVLEQEDEHATAKGKAVVSTLTDAITLAMQCFHDMNSSRRQAMKKDLHSDYAALCTSSTIPPTSEYLFGDLSKLTKDISDANKLAKKVRPQQARAHNRKYSTSSQRNQGNRRYQPYQRPQTDFLSKGRLPRSKFKKEGDTKQT